MRFYPILAAALTAALVTATGLPSVGAAEEAAEETPKATLEGEMVDMKCYVGMGMPGGGKHNKCAIDCAKMGIPAGVVDSRTGQAFILLAPAPGLAQYMGKTVRVTGTLADKSTAILPESIEVKEGDQWVKGELPKGMM